jgi:PIN domain nuclease of toxin-antitoxin system
MASLKSLLASIFLSVLSCWCLGNAQNTNTIKPGDKVTTDYLASANGRFHLGFNQIDPEVIYLAIFYATGPQNDWL